MLHFDPHCDTSLRPTVDDSVILRLFNINDKNDSSPSCRRSIRFTAWSQTASTSIDVLVASVCAQLAPMSLTPVGFQVTPLILKVGILADRDSTKSF